MIWNIDNICSFLKKKINVQIISPTIFLITYTIVFNINIESAFLSEYKYGYWFTFTLFYFFVLYIFLYKILYIIKKESMRDVFFIFIGLATYVIISKYTAIIENKNNIILDSIGFIHLKYFLFFIFGTMIRKYFSKFEYALTNTSLLLVSICIFFGFNILRDIVLSINITGFYLATAVTGIIIIFALFKKNNDTFSHNHTVGRIMQFIGRRTLDIYLLHYFFIMTNMDNVLPNFSTLNSPFLEFICSLIISIFVILACLAVSHILRLSPALGYFLFGQKRKVNQNL